MATETGTKKKKITIALPILMPMEILPLTCLLNMAIRKTKSAEYEVEVKFIGRLIITQARNLFAEDAMNTGADYILFIDTDQTYPVETLERVLVHDKDICGMLYFMRRLPAEPCMLRAERHDNRVEYKPIKEYPRGLLEVDGIGMGFTLIKTHVFRKIEKPWFWIIYPSVTEDIYFCIKAQQAGYKIFVDTTHPIGHLYNPPTITEETYRTGNLFFEGQITKFY